MLFSSNVLGQLLQAPALTLSPLGRSPARPSSSFSSETWGKKAHFHLLVNVWGSCVPLSSQRQGWCSEPALIHNQHRPGGQLGQAGDAHTPQGRAVFPRRLGSEGTWGRNDPGQSRSKSHTVVCACLCASQEVQQFPSVGRDRFLFSSAPDATLITLCFGRISLSLILCSWICVI